MKLKLRKDDMVQVIAGNNRKRQESGEEKTPAFRGRILSVDPKRETVVVEGINLRKHHTRVRQAKDGSMLGGIEEREAPIHVSNVMLVDPKTDKPVRVGTKVVDGKRVRYTKGKNASGTILDDKA
jgi:large subunit ribosomal protein L24